MLASRGGSSEPGVVTGHDARPVFLLELAEDGRGRELVPVQAAPPGLVSPGASVVFCREQEPLAPDADGPRVLLRANDDHVSWLQREVVAAGPTAVEELQGVLRAVVKKPVVVPPRHEHQPTAVRHLQHANTALLARLLCGQHDPWGRSEHWVSWAAVVIE